MEQPNRPPTPPPDPASGGQSLWDLREANRTGNTPAPPLPLPSSAPAPAPTPPAPAPARLGLSKGLIAALIGAGVIFLFIASLLSGEATTFVLVSIIMAIILAICAASSALSLPGKRITLVFMGLAAILNVSTLFLGDLFYAVLLKVLNSFTDPGQREFMPDYGKLPGGYGSPKDNSGQGSEILGFFGFIFFSLGVVTAAAGTALRLLGWSKTPAPAPAASAPSSPASPVRFSGLGRADKVGLILVLVGIVLVFSIGLVSVILDEALPTGFDEPLFVVMGLIGGTIFSCGCVVLMLAGPRRRAAVRAAMAGWGWGRLVLEIGRLDMTWLNYLGLALIFISMTISRFGVLYQESGGLLLFGVLILAGGFLRASRIFYGLSNYLLYLPGVLLIFGGIIWWLSLAVGISDAPMLGVIAALVGGLFLIALAHIPLYRKT